jgi:hypothetical protein
MGLARNIHLGYCFGGLSLNLNLLFTLCDVRLLPAPVTEAGFATPPSRQSALLILEAIY